MSVSSVVINTSGADGAYYSQAPQSSFPTPQISEALTIMIGTATWGTPGVFVPFNNLTGMYDAFGRCTGATNSLTDESYNFLANSSAAGGIRVATGDTAARINIPDTASSPGVFGTLIGACTGSRPNSGGNIVFRTAASSTTAKPLYNAILTMPDASPETFNNIPGYTVSGSTVTISAAAFNANLATAINIGANQQAPSNYWIYVPGTTTSMPLIGTSFPVTTLGTDGSTVTTAQLLGTGTAATSAPQGIYAAAGTKAGAFVLCGCTDVTANATAALFAQQNFMLAFGPVFSSGTSKSSAISQKSANNMTSGYAWPLKDWINIISPVSGTKTLVSPLGFIAGIVSGQPPQNSVGRKPKGGAAGILGTERVTPYQLQDIGDLTTAGIGFLIPSANGGGYVLAHGQNASGLAGQDGINFIRMSNNIAKTAPLILDPFVDELIGTSANDPTIRGARKAMLAWLNGWVKTGVIDGRYVLCDNTNNTQQTIQQSQLNCTIGVSLKGVARFIQIIGSVGVATITDVTGQFSASLVTSS